jgi:YfiH family protein
MLYKKNPLHIFFGDKKTAENRVQLQLNQSNLPHIAVLARTHDLNRIIRLDQTHSNIGYAVTQDTRESFTQNCFPGDFLMTNLKQVGLLIYTADCLPIIFYDQVKQAIALAHAGWKGSVQNIVQHTFNKLHEQYGCQSQDIQIFFGPSAHACCYQVGPEFNSYITSYSDSQKAQILKQYDNNYYFNNQLYNKAQLEAVGIHQFNTDYAVCTMCNNQFCSYRRDPQIGERQLTVVWLS